MLQQWNLHSSWQEPEAGVMVPRGWGRSQEWETTGRADEFAQRAAALEIKKGLRNTQKVQQLVRVLAAALGVQLPASASGQRAECKLSV